VNTISGPARLGVREVGHAESAMLATVAGIHIQLLRPGALAEMGTSFVREVGLRLLLLDGSLRVAVLTDGDSVGGFVAFTGLARTYQRRSFLKHPLAVTWACIKALCTDPRRVRAIVDMAHDALAPEPAADAQGEPLGEVLAIAVTPECLSAAAKDKSQPPPGDQLLDFAIAGLQSAGVHKLRARISANRHGALMLYAKRKAKFADYRTRREAMVQVTLDI
jgi:hypothetical protein